MSGPLNHLGSVWYQSETSEFLALDFFCHFLQQDGSRLLILITPDTYVKTNRTQADKSFVCRTKEIQNELHFYESNSKPE